MSRNTRVVAATPEHVWEALSDGWTYPLWVVGAARMRDVDDDFPSVGSCLHHSVGTWPLMLDDTTEVLESRPQTFLKLRARAWPGGSAEVILRLRPVGAKTEIVIEEDAVSGPALLMPKPLRDLTLKWRNSETLQRLAYLVEQRE